MYKEQDFRVANKYNELREINPLYVRGLKGLYLARKEGLLTRDMLYQIKRDPYFEGLLNANLARYNRSVSELSKDHDQ